MKLETTVNGCLNYLTFLLPKVKVARVDLPCIHYLWPKDKVGGSSVSDLSEFPSHLCIPSPISVLGCKTFSQSISDI